MCLQFSLASAPHEIAHIGLYCARYIYRCSMLFAIYISCVCEWVAAHRTLVPVTLLITAPLTVCLCLCCFQVSATAGAGTFTTAILPVVIARSQLFLQRGGTVSDLKLIKPGAPLLLTAHASASSSVHQPLPYYLPSCYQQHLLASLKCLNILINAPAIVLLSSLLLSAASACHVSNA